MEGPYDQDYVGIRAPATNSADFMRSPFTRRRLGNLPGWIAYLAIRGSEPQQVFEMLF